MRKQDTLKLAVFTVTALFVAPIFADTTAYTAVPPPGAAPAPSMAVMQPVMANANSDCLITTAVLGKLESDNLLNGQTIRVSTVRGVVSLDGTVSNTNDVTEAVSQARSVAGVSDVKTYLTVQTGPSNPNGTS